jgi:hypothetical protein
VVRSDSFLLPGHDVERTLHFILDLRYVLASPFRMDSASSGLSTVSSGTDEAAPGAALSPIFQKVLIEKTPRVAYRQRIGGVFARLLQLGSLLRDACVNRRRA